MGKTFRRKHIIKFVTIGLYALMILTMIVGYTMKGTF
jgi:hypothetical protein